MPATELAAKRYAQAAFEIAAAAGSFEDWRNAVERMAEFMGDTEVKGVLENTRVPQESKQRLVAAGLADLPALPLNLARLLVKKGRSGLAQEVANGFAQLVEEREGVARARAITAVPLSDAERDALAERLQRETGRRIVLETEVDPNLLGGVRVQIGDQLVDASTRARLSALRDSLVRAV
jgi:F-type H+-transporting ATPase subunit delta